MNQDQWTRAYEHALRAVDVDNIVRVWFPTAISSDAATPVMGLVFSCKRGKVDMQRPIGMLL